jgi:1,4-alpha-glucan branching enzyme
MVELASSYAHSEPNGLLRRGLNQAARELLLAQSSDWAFIMKTQTHSSYAFRRTKDHVYRFTRLYDEIKSGRIDERFLSDTESKDNLFPDIDYRIYSRK